MEEAFKILCEKLKQTAEKLATLFREIRKIINNVDDGSEIKGYRNRLRPNKEIKPRAVPFIFRRVFAKCTSNC